MLYVFMQLKSGYELEQTFWCTDSYSNIVEIVALEFNKGSAVALHHKWLD